MSFSDFGRTAIAALSSAVPLTQTPPPSGVQKSRNVRRASDPMPPRRAAGGKKKPPAASRGSRSRSDGGRRGAREGNRRRSDGGAIASFEGSSQPNPLEISRGVRPRLDNIQCPVTEKTLMDDVLTVLSGGNEVSLASTSYSSATSNRDHSSTAVANDDSDSEDTDRHSYSDSGLNPSDRHDESNSRSHRRRSSSNKHRRSNSHLNGRKDVLQNQENLEEDPQSRNSRHDRRRRLPRHYNTIPDAEAHGSRNTTHSKHRHDSSSKRNRSKSKEGIHNSNETRHPNRSKSSESSKLSTGIAQFQKMVAELESLSKISSSSPEEMWKTRILLRSAVDAERDLQVALEREHARTEGEKGVPRSVVAAARNKMKRDYHRASKQLRSIVDEMERRQRAEISTLTASEAAAAHREGAPDHRSRNAAVVEEEFFDRAMRERQDEVQKISDGMKKVQDIYTDLAGLVDDQQEQIDKLADLNEEVKADTRAGLEEIQHGIWKLCAAEGPEMSTEGDNGQLAAHRGKSKKTIPDPREMLGCVMDCPGLPTTTTKPRSGRGILSVHDLEESSVHARVKYYSDNNPPPAATSMDWRWNLPNLEEVQESAQSAYERGHAIVGDLVEHAKREGLPHRLGEEFTNRLSCTTPRADDDQLSLDGGDDDDHGIVLDGTVRRFGDTKTQTAIPDDRLPQGEEGLDDGGGDRRRRSRSSSRRRSGSRSSAREHESRRRSDRGQRRSGSSSSR